MTRHWRTRARYRRPMDAAWTEFLRGANGPEHAAQVYADVDELAASVAAAIAVGFASGQPALVIATHAHWQTFAAHLRACGWDPERAADDGLLVVADAEDVLQAVMNGHGPDAGRFEAVVGSLVDDLAARFPAATIRAFGEVVDLLCARGQPAAAVALEELWTALARRHRFSLLCAYHADVLAGGHRSELLSEVCRVHDQVLLPSA